MQDVGVRERLTGEVVKMYSPPSGGTMIYIEFRLEQDGELLKPKLSVQIPSVTINPTPSKPNITANPQPLTLKP